MASKSKKKQEPTEIQQLNLHVLRLIGRVLKLEKVVKQNIYYSEYIAGMVDRSIDYTEFLTRLKAEQESDCIGKKIDFLGSESIPTFLQYMEVLQRQEDEGIPF